MKVTKTDVNLTLALLRWVLPMAAAWYAFNRIGSGITNVFSLPEKTLKDWFGDSQVKTNFGGVGLMSHDLGGEDYQMSSTAFESWRSLHPDNDKILSIVLDPLRRVKPQYIEYIDNMVIDRQLLEDLGAWH